MGPDVGQYGPVGACLAIVLAILWAILAQYMTMTMTMTMKCILLRHTISTMYHGIIFKSCKKHNILQ